jgi:photosystem II stability/assembly factor-like uncharacterized protein
LRGRRNGHANEDWLEAEHQLGTKNVILQTQDRGVTWDVHDTADEPLSPEPSSIWFADQLRGARPANYGIEYTTDGGQTWWAATHRGESTNMIGDLCFARPVGYAIAGNYSGTFTLLRSDDAGASWESIYREGLGPLDKV